MIQINLVPDIKQEMLRAQRMRNVAISTSIIVGLGAAAIVVVMALVLGAQVAVQKLQEGQISSGYAELSAREGLNSALTVQHQLKTISGQNASRTMDSRLLDVIAAINPPAPDDVKISRVTLDPVAHTITLEGSAAGGYPSTDVFRKTIFNTKVSYIASGSTEATEVPLTTEDKFTLRDTSYGEDSSGAKVVRFTIDFIYPEGMLDNTMKSVKVSTPSARIDVTDSKTRVPDSMFSTAAKDTEGNN